MKFLLFIKVKKKISEFYNICFEINNEKIIKARCNCSYNKEGWCKHVYFYFK